MEFPQKNMEQFNSEPMEEHSQEQLPPMPGDLDDDQQRALREAIKSLRERNDLA